jgi:hypothetical protein
VRNDNTFQHCGVLHRKNASGGPYLSKNFPLWGYIRSTRTKTIDFEADQAVYERGKTCGMGWGCWREEF